MVGLYWVPGNAGVQGNEIAGRLAKDGSVLFTDLSDLSRPWGGFKAERDKERQNAEWMTGIWQYVAVRVVLTG